ncbi:hypothetical protein STEG23_026064, partial [Scotinomys teguina]
MVLALTENSKTEIDLERNSYDCPNQDRSYEACLAKMTTVPREGSKLKEKFLPEVCYVPGTGELEDGWKLTENRLSVEGWLAYSKLQIVKSFHNEATAFSIVTVVQVLTAMFLPHWTIARHLG